MPCDDMILAPGLRDMARPLKDTRRYLHHTLMLRRDASVPQELIIFEKAEFGWVEIFRNGCVLLSRRNSRLCMNSLYCDI